MDSLEWINDFPTLAELPPDEAALKLRAVGEDEVAEALEQALAVGEVSQTYSFLGIGGPRAAYQEAGSEIGYLAPGRPSEKYTPIIPALRVTPDSSLKKAALKITLDRFYVAKYPGRGRHRIFLNFSIRNQARGHETQIVHFDTTCEAQDGAPTAIQGYPIFLGAKVGNEGLEFTCLAINVENEQDRQILDILNSKAFKGGLKLATTFQPALAPLSELAMGLMQILRERHNNQQVYKSILGFDFSTLQTRPVLAEGSYIVVQAPSGDSWSWDDWVYHVDNGLVVKAADPQQSIPYNYFIFGISRYQE